MNLFERVFRELNKAKVKYLVVGGVAVNLHGYVRFTGDLDILLLLEEKNLKKMDMVMKKLKYIERLPVSIMDLSDSKKVKTWLQEKNMTAFTFVPERDNPLQIDILVEKSLKFEKMSRDKVIKRISNVAIPVIAIDKLIIMKKEAGRDQDITDLEALLNIKKI